MQLKTTLFLLIAGLFSSCSDSELKSENILLASELEKLKEELRICSLELTEIKNTPEQRNMRAQKYFAEGDLNASITEYQGIIDNYAGTSDAENAIKEIEEIEAIIERNRVEAERKKALGYKILKPNSNPKFDGLSLRIEKVWTGKRWSFDDYGHEYRLRDATRGNVHLLVRVSIESETNNPLLPPFLAYQMIDGELKLLGTLGYEFRRWKDYGSYLGNYADYGNDFSHSKSVSFNLGFEVNSSDIENKDVFVVVKSTGCFKREVNRLGRPEIRYSQGTCNAKQTLQIEDFDKEYILIKKL
ncbi:MAG: hypothetical protein O2818_00625 [Bacteroidetes bacterium]|nr:hypothetical protein [Bacteroidota bacterium]MDA1335366.1 hypothetical protein [Bacteroidota bacterium]